MRLQEIYYICRNARDSWEKLELNEVNSAGHHYFKLQNADLIRSLLSSLDTIESFADDIAAIRSRSLEFSQPTGEITISSQKKSSLEDHYNKLITKVIAITELFESLNYRQDSDGFDIKLPAEISLSELSKCAKDLNTIFSTCPLFANQQGTITFSAVDVGSVWLSFFIGGTAAAGVLRILAELVDKALVIRSHYLTAKEQEEKIRILELGEESMKTVVEVNKTILNGLMDKVCSELAEEHSIQEPEDKSRLKNSIQLLSDWMNKGLEVYASVQAAPEVKAVFPAIEKQSLPESIVALLTDGTDTAE